MSEIPLNDEIDLPDLHQGLLDPETLQVYFEDLARHADVFDVIAKGAPEAYALEKTIDLELGRSLLDAGAVRGLQVRYHFNGGEWWDTLIRVSEGVRLVRIEHHFE